MSGKYTCVGFSRYTQEGDHSRLQLIVRVGELFVSIFILLSVSNCFGQDDSIRIGDTIAYSDYGFEFIQYGINNYKIVDGDTINYYDKKGLRQGKFVEVYEYEYGKINHSYFSLYPQCKRLQIISYYKDGYYNGSHGIYCIENNGERSIIDKGNYVNGIQIGEIVEGKWGNRYLIGKTQPVFIHKDNHQGGVVYDFRGMGSELGDSIWVKSQKQGLFKLVDKKTGKLIGDMYYKDGILNGPFHFYHPNGQISSEGFNKNDVTVGVQKYYNEEGSLIKEAIYEKGEIIHINKYNND
ncbi:MAG: hypothetical protein WD334_09510 [Chitinophagales bacterium]